jgi:hypothetical protein
MLGGAEEQVNVKKNQVGTAGIRLECAGREMAGSKEEHGQN